MAKGPGGMVENIYIKDINMRDIHLRNIVCDGAEESIFVRGPNKIKL